jgi:hypothetical protein
LFGICFWRKFVAKWLDFLDFDLLFQMLLPRGQFAFLAEKLDFFAIGFSQLLLESLNLRFQRPIETL